MIGEMTADLKDLILSNIPILLKDVGVKLVGTFLGVKKADFSNVDVFVVKAKHACYGRVGILGEPMIVMPGGLVGFGLSERAREDFRLMSVQEGDVVSLVVHGSRDVSGDGRFVWDETFTAIVVEATLVKAASSSRSWVDIVASAMDAYSSTGGNFRDKMLLLAGSLIDFDSDRDMSRLISEASLAKKAYDQEIIEHGQCKTADDGGNNWIRWRRAADALAKALIDGTS